jgi:hypothetical protein
MAYKKKKEKKVPTQPYETFSSLQVFNFNNNFCATLLELE